VLAVTVRADLPAHDGATLRIEADFKPAAAIRLLQLGERGCFGHIRFVKQKSGRRVNEDRVLLVGRALCLMIARKPGVSQVACGLLRYVVIAQRYVKGCRGTKKTGFGGREICGL